MSKPKMPFETQTSLPKAPTLFVAAIAYNNLQISTMIIFFRPVPALFHGCQIAAHLARKRLWFYLFNAPLLQPQHAITAASESKIVGGNERG
jgi:hypothetical protein